MGIIAVGLAVATACGNTASADDEDHWLLLPKQVTADALEAADAVLVAASRVPKANGGELTVTYWRAGRRTYRCVDQLDSLGGTVDAYCYQQQTPERAPSLKD